jgi:hypothetical protein
MSLVPFIALCLAIASTVWTAWLLWTNRKR